MRETREARLIDQIISFKNRCDLEALVGKRYGLSTREVAALSLLKGGPSNAGELSCGIGVSPSRGSRIIGRLVRGGFIDSRPGRGDRRSLTLSLSEYGKACLVELELEKDECERRFSAALGREEFKAARDGMKILLQALQGDTSE